MEYYIYRKSDLVSVCMFRFFRETRRCPKSFLNNFCISNECSCEISRITYVGTFAVAVVQNSYPNPFLRKQSCKFFYKRTYHAFAWDLRSVMASIFFGVSETRFLEHFYQGCKSRNLNFCWILPSLVFTTGTTNEGISEFAYSPVQSVAFKK